MLGVMGKCSSGDNGLVQETGKCRMLLTCVLISTCKVCKSMKLEIITIALVAWNVKFMSQDHVIGCGEYDETKRLPDNHICIAQPVHAR